MSTRPSAAAVISDAVTPYGATQPRAVEADARRLPPTERLALLCDTGSLQRVRSAVTSPRLGDKCQDGDGVVAATGRIDGRPVVCYPQDARFAGGSVGAAHAATIVRLLRMAARATAPVIGFVESAGARIQEGLAALDGYADTLLGADLRSAYVYGASKPAPASRAQQEAQLQQRAQQEQLIALRAQAGALDSAHRTRQAIGPH